MVYYLYLFISTGDVIRVTSASVAESIPSLAATPGDFWGFCSVLVPWHFCNLTKRVRIATLGF